MNTVLRLAKNLSTICTAAFSAWSSLLPTDLSVFETLYTEYSWESIKSKVVTENKLSNIQHTEEKI